MDFVPRDGPVDGKGSFSQEGGKGINSGFGKSSLKHSTSFRVLSSNQNLVRALTRTPKAMARTTSSCCLATTGTKTAGSARILPSSGACFPDWIEGI